MLVATAGFPEKQTSKQLVFSGIYLSVWKHSKSQTLQNESTVKTRQTSRLRLLHECRKFHRLLSISVPLTCLFVCDDHWDNFQVVRRVKVLLKSLQSDTRLVQGHFVLLFCACLSDADFFCCVVLNTTHIIMTLQIPQRGLPSSVYPPPHPQPTVLLFRGRAGETKKKKLTVYSPSGMTVQRLQARVLLPSRSRCAHVFLWPTPIPSLKQVKAVCELQKTPLKL